MSAANPDESQSQVGERQTRQRGKTRRLLQLVDDLYVFRDEKGEPYIQVPTERSYRILRLQSREFKYYLGSVLWQNEGDGLSDEIFRTVVNTLSGKAVSSRDVIPLAVRCAWQSSDIFYDLSCPDGTMAVRVRPGDWLIIEKPPILFRHFSHQREQVIPDKANGDVWLFLQYVHLSNERDRLLFLVYLVTAFIPDISHPILILQGEAGSGKSFAMKLLKDLIDPSSLSVTGVPKTTTDFVQAASHHYCLFLDNITFLPNPLADCLCRACTGEGLSKRRLYTDDDDIIYNFRSVVGLNGVALNIDRSDILDRAILFACRRISGTDLRSESELLANFEADKPRILGGIFDILARALEVKASLCLPALSRMTDFVLWGCAVGRALGHTDEDFLKAYSANLSGQHYEIVSASPVAQTLLSFMSDKEEWHGTSSSLFEALQGIAENLKLAKAPSFPKDPRWLWRRLVEVSPSLHALGLTVTRSLSRIGTTLRVVKNDTTDTAKSELIPQQVGDIVKDVTTPREGENKLKESSGDNGGDSGIISSTLMGISSVLGMAVDEALSIWRSQGAPVIRLRPGESCFDLEKLLSRSDVNREHLEAVKSWLNSVNENHESPDN